MPPNDYFTTVEIVDLNLNQTRQKVLYVYRFICRSIFKLPSREGYFNEAYIQNLFKQVLPWTCSSLAQLAKSLQDPKTEKLFTECIPMQQYVSEQILLLNDLVFFNSVKFCYNFYVANL
jgi:hypothetical protein